MEFRSILGTARLHKILARNPDTRLGLIRLDVGEFAEDEEEMLNPLKKLHFSGVQGTQTEQEEGDWEQERQNALWNFATKDVDIDEVE